MPGGPSAPENLEGQFLSNGKREIEGNVVRINLLRVVFELLRGWAGPA